MTLSASYHDKAYVCVHVFDSSRPILLVSRSGGDWSFLCGAVHEALRRTIELLGRDISSIGTRLSMSWQTWVRTGRLSGHPSAMPGYADRLRRMIRPFRTDSRLTAVAAAKHCVGCGFVAMMVA